MKIIGIFQHYFHLLALYVGRGNGKLLQFFERCREQVGNERIDLIGFADDLSVVRPVFLTIRYGKSDFGNGFDACNRRLDIVG